MESNNGCVLYLAKKETTTQRRAAEPCILDSSSRTKRIQYEWKAVINARGINPFPPMMYIPNAMPFSCGNTLNQEETTQLLVYLAHLPVALSATPLALVVTPDVCPRVWCHDACPIVL